MQLNLPILGQLQDNKNILIAGAGGGFDVFAGLPIYFALRELGKTVHLANYSFMDIRLSGFLSDQIMLVKEKLVGATGTVHYAIQYYPEGFLAQWFQQERGEDVPIWMFSKVGAEELEGLYRTLVDHLKIDAIVLVDGGVDSLMRGDESGAGTLVEDTISLAAVEPLDVPVKLLACIGFGTEVEEGVCHYSALENMAGLAKEGALLGSCLLVPQMPVFQQFEAACRYVWEQPEHKKSHITTRVIPAAHGEFGDFHMYADDHRIRIFVSPLMAVYWFFDATVVAKRSLILDRVRKSPTAYDALRDTMFYYDGLTRRRSSRPFPH